MKVTRLYTPGYTALCKGRVFDKPAEGGRGESRARMGKSILFLGPGNPAYYLGVRNPGGGDCEQIAEWRKAVVDCTKPARDRSQAYRYIPHGLCTQLRVQTPIQYRYPRTRARRLLGTGSIFVYYAAVVPLACAFAYVQELPANCQLPGSMLALLPRACHIVCQLS